MSLLPHSNIRVDNFEFMKNDLTQYVFFLSHCHEGKFLPQSLSILPCYPLPNFCASPISGGIEEMAFICIRHLFLGSHFGLVLTVVKI